MSIQTTQSPRYVIVVSSKFYGHYDVLDTKTQKREPQGNVRSLRMLRLSVAKLNTSSIIK
jgi:hypothetical protein